MTLPPHLWDIKEQIREVAQRLNLDFFETVFEIIDYHKMNSIASYGGFPTRYPHWRFGMEYEQLSKSYSYGLSKIYEMVINNDPCYAYLLEGNNLVDQKTVIAHVYGHCDFFKNNAYFAKTNRKMMDEMANHATRVRRYIDRLGLDRVEDFIDVCLSIDNLIDMHSPYIIRQREPSPEEELAQLEVPKLPSKDYMDEFINPPAYLEAQRKKLQAQREQRRNFPADPTRDVMAFLLEHAPLERWEADILSIIREEAYYFAPQAMTKIMNEGWASYWHSTILTKHVLDASEIIDYAESYAGVMATSPGGFNPYKIGIELFRHIEDRWNKGQFGKEWEECDDIAAKESWDKQLGLGRHKIFQVRAIYNDVSFIDEFLTEDFAREQKLFTYGHNKKTNNWEIQSREFKQVKEQLLKQLTNFGQPFIYVRDGNLGNRSELLLHHRHQGIDLKLDYARDVLQNLYKIWRRPVNLETLVDDKGRLFTYNGTQHSDKAWDYKAL
jgi:stage V sporulation protein R